MRLYFATTEEHINHEGYYRGGFTFSSFIIGGPLHNDENIHVAKEGPEEQNLWDELVEEVNWPSEIDSIESFHYYSKRHLKHS